MTTTRAAILGLLASMALAPAAMAADLGGAPRSIKDDPIPYQPAVSWTGLYVGTHAGYAWSDTDWQDALGSSSHEGSGWLAGGQIGYNLQLQHIVIGVEADASSAWLDGSASCAGGGTCSHNFNWLASLRGRAGVAFNGNRTMLYGTAGFAWADVDYASTNGVGLTERHSGWVAGAGIEHMLSTNLSARVEYLYYAFDDVTAPAGALGGGLTTLDPSTQTVRFGLNLKF